MFGKIKKTDLSKYKKDSVGLFSGRFKKQVFQGKKEKLEKLAKKEKQTTYESEKIQILSETLC